MSWYEVNKWGLFHGSKWRQSKWNHVNIFTVHPSVSQVVRLLPPLQLRGTSLLACHVRRQTITNVVWTLKQNVCMKGSKSPKSEGFFCFVLFYLWKHIYNIYHIRLYFFFSRHINVWLLYCIWYVHHWSMTSCCRTWLCCWIVFKVEG